MDYEPPTFLFWKVMLERCIRGHVIVAMQWLTTSSSDYIWITLYYLHFCLSIIFMYLSLSYILVCSFPNTDIVLVELLEDIIWFIIENFFICMWKRGHSILYLFSFLICSIGLWYIGVQVNHTHSYILYFFDAELRVRLVKQIMRWARLIGRTSELLVQGLIPNFICFYCLYFFLEIFINLFLNRLLYSYSLSVLIFFTYDFKFWALELYFIQIQILLSFILLPQFVLQILYWVYFLLFAFFNCLGVGLTYLVLKIDRCHHDLDFWIVILYSSQIA